jgi:hypothetical protein
VLIPRFIPIFLCLTMFLLIENALEGKILINQHGLATILAKMMPKLAPSLYLKQFSRRKPHKMDNFSLRYSPSYTSVYIPLSHLIRF